MVRVEYLGAVHAPMWTQPHPQSPAPLQGPSPQLLVSEEANCAITQEGAMILLCQYLGQESQLLPTSASTSGPKVPAPPSVISQLQEVGETKEEAEK